VDVTHAGQQVRESALGRPTVDGELVTFTLVYTSPAWSEPETSTSTLRFLPHATLEDLLSQAGLRVEAEYGDWDRQPFTDSSPEIITVARKA
jgi:hypothetical protein